MWREDCGEKREDREGYKPAEKDEPARPRRQNDLPAANVARAMVRMIIRMCI